MQLWLIFRHQCVVAIYSIRLNVIRFRLLLSRFAQYNSSLTLGLCIFQHRQNKTQCQLSCVLFRSFPSRSTSSTSLCVNLNHEALGTSALGLPLSVVRTSEVWAKPSISRYECRVWGKCSAISDLSSNSQYGPRLYENSKFLGDIRMNFHHCVDFGRPMKQND